MSDENLSPSRCRPVIGTFFPIVDLLAEFFGPHCEVVLHDYSLPRGTIVKIRNSNLASAKDFWGIEVSPETLVSKVIHEVGPGGHFRGTDHTLNYIKREFWYPCLPDRSRWEEWQVDGARSRGEHGQVYLEDMLRNHRPVPLAPKVTRQIDVILTNAEARYAASR